MPIPPAVLAVSAALVLVFAADAEWTPPPGVCHAGAYALSDGSRVILTPSDEPNLRYRFEDGRSGRLYLGEDGRYTSGEGWSVAEPVILTVETGACGDGHVRFEYTDGPALDGERIALPVEPVTAERDGVRLYGELVLPQDGDAEAVIVLQYGSGPDSAVAFNYVQHLLPLHGIAVLVFDKRGTGRSTGEFSADIETLAHDAAAMVEALPDRVDGLPVGLMGESQGGWVVPLAALESGADFVVVGYGLAVPMQEEDRLEVRQSLAQAGYGPDVLALGETMHAAAMRVANSRFADGLDELSALKARYRDEAWFDALGGDITGLLTATPDAEMEAVRRMLDFPYDLTYDSLPAIQALEVPLLWVLAGADTEAPHENTLAILENLQAQGQPVDIAIFPDAEHGLIAVDGNPGEDRRLAGRYAEGYFGLLVDWIRTREFSGPYGEARLVPATRNED